VLGTAPARNGHFRHGVTRYQPTIDKVMRLHAQTAIIDNGFVYAEAVRA
jgi:phage terminase large subunit-like protein